MTTKKRIGILVQAAMAGIEFSTLSFSIRQEIYVLTFAMAASLFATFFYTLEIALIPEEENETT